MTAAARFLANQRDTIDTMAAFFAAHGVWDGPAQGRPPVPPDLAYGRSVIAQLWLDLGICHLQRGLPDEATVCAYIIDVHMTVQGHTNRYHSERYLRERYAHAGPLWQPTVAVARGMRQACARYDAANGSNYCTCFVRCSTLYLAGMLAPDDAFGAAFQAALESEGD